MSLKKLKPHHIAWLSRHPERSEAWLRQMFRDGFDIHHIDGDHENNDPENLILIESGDHFLLHGVKRLSRVSGGWAPAEEAHSRRMSLGEEAYRARASGLLWWEVSAQLGYKDHMGAILVAKRYAQYHGLEWPIQVDVSERKPQTARRDPDKEAARRAERDKLYEPGGALAEKYESMKEPSPRRQRRQIDRWWRRV